MDLKNFVMQSSLGQSKATDLEKEIGYKAAGQSEYLGEYEQIGSPRPVNNYRSVALNQNFSLNNGQKQDQRRSKKLVSSKRASEVPAVVILV